MIKTDIANKIISLQSKSPLVSILIPAYNEEKYLFKTIEALSKLETKYPIEIILVDNGSTDNTKEIAESYGMKVIDEKRKGTSYARQAGLAAANGEYIFTTDADTLVPPTWIDGSLHYFQEDKNISFLSGGFYYENANWLFYVGKYLLKILRYFFSKKSALDTIYGFNCVFKREQALKVGGYTPGIDLGEDKLLAIKLGKIGKIISIVDKKTAVKTSGRRFLNIKRVYTYIGSQWINEYTTDIVGKSPKTTFSDIR